MLSTICFHTRNQFRKNMLQHPKVAIFLPLKVTVASPVIVVIVVQFLPDLDSEHQL